MEKANIAIRKLVLANKQLETAINVRTNTLRSAGE
jgi:hypothetical protein